jgi:sulfate adenylyltransferase subunit 2
MRLRQFGGFLPRFVPYLLSTGRENRALPEKLSPHLQDLESEAIYIVREVAAEFAKPVLLYSIGKDSSVLLHFARKAFFPAEPPFPLLHIDTCWKFREMIAFRDAKAKRLGLDLTVYVNEEPVAKQHQSDRFRLRA